MDGQYGTAIILLDSCAVSTAAHCSDWSEQVRIASRSVWRTPPPRPEGVSVCRVGVPNPLVPEQVGSLLSIWTLGNLLLCWDLRVPAAPRTYPRLLACYTQLIHAECLACLFAEQIAAIEACGNVKVYCLSEAAARHLRGRATDEDDVAACVAEIDEKMGKAEVYLASFWDMVPGTTQLATTRFPPNLNWVCVNQAGAAQIGAKSILGPVFSPCCHRCKRVVSTFGEGCRCFGRC
eukprot:COSAG02_NODE_1785_length_10940_cov_9.153399_9_plen_235_part_00